MIHKYSAYDLLATGVLFAGFTVMGTMMGTSPPAPTKPALVSRMSDLESKLYKKVGAGQDHIAELTKQQFILTSNPSYKKEKIEYNEEEERYNQEFGRHIGYGAGIVVFTFAGIIALLCKGTSENTAARSKKYGMYGAGAKVP